MKSIITGVSILAFSLFSIGQDAEPNVRRIVQKKSYVGLGGNLAGFQNVKFSNTQYSGLGAYFTVGTSRDSKLYQWNTGLRINYSGLATAQHDGVGFNVNLNYSFQYLRKLTENYAIGGQADLANIHFTRFAALGNNSVGIILNSTAFVTGKYSRQLNENMNLGFDVSIGLFGLVRESTSFAYSAPQKVLEEGVFNFQDDATTSPIHLKYGSFEPIGKLNAIRTGLALDFKKRWQFSYNWDMFNYRTVAGYPITIARHMIGVQFNYINKEKKRINKK